MEKETLEKIILDKILNNQSILIVAPTDEGKTWFIKNSLIPFFKRNGLKTEYINEAIYSPIKKGDFDVLIADEFESFIDKNYLEEKYPDEKPYYSEEYINSVNLCHNSLRSINSPVIFVLTRNEEDEINFLLNNLSTIDSGQIVSVIPFKRS